MKALKLLSFAALFSAATVFTSCDKDDFSPIDGNDSSFIIDDDSEDGTGDVDSDEPTEEAPKALFFNGLDGLTDVIVLVNGVTVVGELALNQATEYIDLPGNGEIVIQLVSSTGEILFQTTRDVLNNTYYNVFLLLNNLGEPVLELVPLTDLLAGGDSGLGLDILDGLGFGGQDFFLFNVLNLVDLDGDNGLLGLDLLNSDGDIVTGLLEAPFGIVTGLLEGNNGLLSDLNLLGTSLSLDELLNGLLDEGEILGVGSLGGLSILDGVTGIVDGLLDLIGGLLGDILGGGSIFDDLRILDGDILSSAQFEEGHIYTVVLSGVEEAVQTIIIDHTASGLEF